MEIDNVFADKVIELGLAIGLPPGIKVFVMLGTESLETRHVTNGRVEPDIKIFVRVSGNFESKVGCITTDVPVLKTRFNPLSQLVGNRWLQTTAPGPCVSNSVKSPSLKKRWSEALSTGALPDKADTGSIRSEGEYVAPQTSQLSPY